MIAFNNKPASSFITGFTAVFTALPFMLKNNMAKYLVIPFIINIIVLCIIGWYVFSFMDPLLHGMFKGGAWYHNIINYVLSPVLALLLLITSLFAYSITGTLAASPFLDIISLNTEKAMGGEAPDPGFSLLAVLRMAWGMIKLLLLMILLYLLILPVNIIPLGGLVYAVLSFLLTAFFCGFQFYDMPLQRRGYSFGEKISACFRFRTTVIGTGTAFIFISLIPVAGFLSVAVSASGAAIAYRRVMEPSIARLD